MVVVFMVFNILAQNPVWRESLWAIKILAFGGIFIVTFLVGSYFLGQIDNRIRERDEKIAELERLQRIEEEANEEIVSINQMVNDQVIELTRLSQELETAYIDTVNSLAKSLDSRDRYTHGHSERVAGWAVLIAERIGYSREDLQRIRQSALLHDLGKIGVEDSILKKDGPLTDEERKAMQMHPVYGYEILKGVRFLAPCLDGILYHHERMDGKGYPSGLSGYDIPLDARVISVGDVYDAMTSDRPYRKGMPKDKALQIIKEIAGTQLDAELVEVFLEIIREKESAKSGKVAAAV
ncbi:MAG: HD-GYP domain-containing protein [bacterium]